MNATQKRSRLRAALSGPSIVSPATVFNALSARVAESVGYQFGILSGSVCAAIELAAPDLVLQTLTEFAEQVRRISRASTLSLFVDADHGYGNALNVMRTVEELEHAGVAGLCIEDLDQPARYGAGGALTVVSTEEMLGKLRAALQARRDEELVIVARTAALSFKSIAAVVERVRAYAGTGADAIFLTQLKELAHLEAVMRATSLPVIVGGTTSLSREALAACGVRFCLQGHHAIPGMVKALREVYSHLYNGGAVADLRSKVASPQEMEQLLGVERHKQWQEEFLG